jgi:hypothetical protein
MAVILSRVGSASVLKHKLTPDPAHVLHLPPTHEARVGTLLSIALAAAAFGLCPPFRIWRDSTAADFSRHRGDGKSQLARSISDELRTPGAGGELPDSMLGPVSRWMDELSIYPDELFSIMAQRAAIYATAESFR